MRLPHPETIVTYRNDGRIFQESQESSKVGNAHGPRSEQLSSRGFAWHAPASRPAFGAE